MSFPATGPIVPLEGKGDKTSYFMISIRIKSGEKVIPHFIFSHWFSGSIRKPERVNVLAAIGYL